MATAARSATRKSRAQRIVDAYFSLDHFDDRESCCPLIGLPSDVARSSDAVKAAYQDVLEKLLGLLQADLAGPTRASAPCRWSPCASAAWSWRGAWRTRPWPTTCVAPRTGGRKLC